MDTEVTEPLSALAAELGSYLEELAPAEARVAEIKASRDKVERAIRAHPEFNPAEWRKSYGAIATVRESESTEWVGLDPQESYYSAVESAAYALVEALGDGPHTVRVLRGYDSIPEIEIRRKTGISNITFARKAGREGNES